MRICLPVIPNLQQSRNNMLGQESREHLSVRDSFVRPLPLFSMAGRLVYCNQQLSLLPVTMFFFLPGRGFANWWLLHA